MRMRYPLLLACALATATPGAMPGPDTFVGTISDDMCAMNHAVMRMGPTDAECAKACVDEHDGSYVLVDGTHVYRLSDQPAAKRFAGAKVTVTGTLDDATGTITVVSIAAP
jgi:hypothetical protein